LLPRELLNAGTANKHFYALRYESCLWKGHYEDLCNDQIKFIDSQENTNNFTALYKCESIAAKNFKNISQFTPLIRNFDDDHKWDNNQTTAMTEKYLVTSSGNSLLIFELNDLNKEPFSWDWERPVSHEIKNLGNNQIVCLDKFSADFKIWDLEQKTCLLNEDSIIATKFFKIGKNFNENKLYYMTNDRLKVWNANQKIIEWDYLLPVSLENYYVELMGINQKEILLSFIGVEDTDFHLISFHLTVDREAQMHFFSSEGFSSVIKNHNFNDAESTKIFISKTLNNLRNSNAYCNRGILINNYYFMFHLDTNALSIWENHQFKGTNKIDFTLRNIFEQTKNPPLMITNDFLFLFTKNNFIKISLNNFTTSESVGFEKEEILAVRSYIIISRRKLHAINRLKIRDTASLQLVGQSKSHTYVMQNQSKVAGYNQYQSDKHLYLLDMNSKKV
jgi:hypothetical protein